MKFVYENNFIYYFKCILRSPIKNFTLAQTIWSNVYSTVESTIWNRFVLLSVAMKLCFTSIITALHSNYRFNLVNKKERIQIRPANMMKLSKLSFEYWLIFEGVVSQSNITVKNQLTLSKFVGKILCLLYEIHNIMNHSERWLWYLDHFCELLSNHNWTAIHHFSIPKWEVSTQTLQPPFTFPNPRLIKVFEKVFKLRIKRIFILYDSTNNFYWVFWW